MKSIASILYKEPYVLEALQIVGSIKNQELWVGAGFIRNTIWNLLHGFSNDYSKCADVDVVYYDNNNLSESEEKEIERQLYALNSAYLWSVKNQARLKIKYQQQHHNLVTAISCWPETATCIAVRLDNNMDLIAPYGFDDLFDLIVRPTPGINHGIYMKRLVEKEWQKKWPKLKIIY